MIGMILALVAAAVGEASPEFDAFFADFAEKRDRVNVLEARFSQMNVTPEETIHSQGAIVYVKPRRIVFRYDEPEPGMTYLIDGVKAYEYEPDIRQLQGYDLEDNRETEIFFLGFDNNAEGLRKAYDVALFEPENKEQGARGILLRPKKREKDGGFFEEVSLYLRDQDYFPYRIHVVNDAESSVVIEISDFTFNGPLDPAKTQIALPEGTRIIVNDELVEKVGPGGTSVPEPATPASDTPPTDKEPVAP